MTRVLVADVETQRAVVETFSLLPNYTPIDRVIVPSRLLCFAARWRGEDKNIFHAAWDDDDEDAFVSMIQAAWKLLDEADFLVGWNSTRFDSQWLQAAFGRLQMGPPSPYRNLDLMQVAKRNFKSGELSLKLDWFAKRWLDDRKTDHEGLDLWHEIRYGSKRQKKVAQKLMMTYNIHDVVLTERLLERMLPWTGENFALCDSDDGKPRCTKCSSENLQKRGFFPTRAYMYQRYYCNDCGSWSRGKRMVYSTELRPV